MVIVKPSISDILRLDRGDFGLFQKACEKLYGKIKEDKYEFCWIVDIRRGGVVVSRFLCDLYRTNNVTDISFDSEYNPDGSRKPPVLKLGLRPEVREMIGDGSILVVDDVCDQGLTPIAAEKYLREEQKISELRFACLYVKPWRQFNPHYWAEETEKWIVFPGEANETIEKILKSSERGKIGRKEAKRLLKHFTQEEIDQAIRSKDFG